MMENKQLAYVIHLRDGPLILSKVRYSDWQAIQDDYEFYMTSVGPWDVDEILSYFETKYKEEASWVFSKDHIRKFIGSREHMLLENNFGLTDIQSKTATSLQFNHYINTLDIEGLSSLMTDDHTFIDSANDVNEGKEKMTKGWQDFFNSYPDYRNIFETIEMKDGVVVMVGYSICSVEPLLDDPALWTSKVRSGLVAEWRVYLDTVENRDKLGI